MKRADNYRKVGFGRDAYLQADRWVWDIGGRKYWCEPIGTAWRLCASMGDSGYKVAELATLEQAGLVAEGFEEASLFYDK